jgi:hypothetical protein
MAVERSQAGKTISGLVTAVNPKGIRLEGRAEWLNLSKFAEIIPPMRGQVVTVTLDRQGWVRAVEASGGPESATAGRETAIIRQTCLKAAAEFCASRPELKSADLFALAERMEQWVGR